MSGRKVKHRPKARPEDLHKRALAHLSKAQRLIERLAELPQHKRGVCADESLFYLGDVFNMLRPFDGEDEENDEDRNPAAPTLRIVGGTEAQS